MSNADKEFVLRACIDCGEDTYNEKRCRDCDIDYAFEQSRCEACGWWMTNGFLFPQQPHDTMNACPWMAL